MKYGFEKINEKECGKSGFWLWFNFLCLSNKKNQFLGFTAHMHCCSLQKSMHQAYQIVLTRASCILGAVCIFWTSIKQKGDWSDWHWPHSAMTNAPFNLMCSHAIFGNTCNMSLLHSSSYCLKNHENISFGFSNLEFPQIWVLWKADFWHENSNIFLSSTVCWDFFVWFSNTVTVPVLKLFGNNNHKLLTRVIHFPKCWKSHHIFPKPIVWFFLQLLHSSLTKDFPFHWGFGWTPCCVIASIKCSKSVEIVGKVFIRANFIR